MLSRFLSAPTDELRHLAVNLCPQNGERGSSHTNQPVRLAMHGLHIRVIAERFATEEVFVDGGLD